MWLVGEHAGTHDDAVKPRSVRRELAADGRSMVVSVWWLPDRVEWPGDPQSRVGQFLQFRGGPVLRCAAVDISSADIEQTHRVSSLLRGDIVPAEEFAVRSRSPWALWGPRDHPSTHRLDAGDVMVRLARRWNDITAWVPDRTMRAPGPVPGAVPQSVVDELQSAATLSSVGIVRPGREQVEFKDGQPRYRFTVEVDAVFRCHPVSWEGAVWFDALWDFGSRANIGSGAQSGLGAFDIRVVRYHETRPLP